MYFHWKFIVLLGFSLPRLRLMKSPVAPLQIEALPKQRPKVYGLPTRT